MAQPKRAPYWARVRAMKKLLLLLILIALGAVAAKKLRVE